MNTFIDLGKVSERTLGVPYIYSNTDPDDGSSWFYRPLAD